METWPFLENPFDNATKGNVLRMLKLDTYHINALTGAPVSAFITARITFYEPYHTALVNAKTALDARVASRLGNTSTVKSLTKDLTGTLIEKWDVAVQNIHPRGTERYIQLFPNLRGPFQTGSVQSRKNALLALSDSIGAEGALGSTKTEIDDFTSELVDAIAEQQGDKGSIIDLTNLLEVARVNAADAMYANLGAFMMEMHKNRPGIAAYFDLVELRRHVQLVFTGSSIALSSKNIFKRTLKAITLLNLINTGTVPLTFFFAMEKNDTTFTISVTVAPGEEEQVSASQLGDVPAAKYLQVKNSDATTAGNWQVEIL